MNLIINICHHHLPTILTLTLTSNDINGEGAQKLLFLNQANEFTMYLATENIYISE